MSRISRFPSVPEWMLGTFAVVDIVLGATMQWNGRRPWIDALRPSVIHTLLSSSIYIVDVVLILVVLRLALQAHWAVSEGLRPSRILLWSGSVVAGVLAWTELWFAAVHHAGHHVNGGVFAAIAMLTYAVWRLPLAVTRPPWTRMLAAAGLAWGQWLYLESVEETWRLWH